MRSRARHGLLLAIGVFSPPCAFAGPLLEVMYLKYEEQPIDLTPVFDPMVSEYRATLDWKMRFFSVQATPQSPGIIDNVHLCPQNADCLKQDQRLVTMDFSKRILVRPGEKALFMFDVLLQGVVMTYTIIVNRLQGTETTLRRMIVQGSTLYPAFRPATSSYNCLMGVADELVNVEMHVLDGGQQLYATSEDPVPLVISDNISSLVNSAPGQTMAPPTRLLLSNEDRGLDEDIDGVLHTTGAPPTKRLLTEEVFGEFQYPKRYMSFPLPLSTTRRLNFKITSADGGHFGYYSMNVARQGCKKEIPLYDIRIGTCVKFCDKGYYPDSKAARCKKCKDTCVNCVSYYNCVECKEDDREFVYRLDNQTGTCAAKGRPFWEQHPQETLAMGLGASCFCVFLIGLYGFHRHSSQSKRPHAQERYMKTRGLELGAPRESAPLRRGSEEELDDYDVY